MASLVCSAVILLATFYLLPWLYYLPKCVLSAMSVPELMKLLENLTRLDSICLVVFSLLREAPHDVAYYWKSVILLLSLKSGLPVTGCAHGWTSVSCS